MDLKNAVAMVTGGGSGLGEATAREFAQAGAHVVILDLPRSPGAKVAESLGDKGLFVAADVASADDVQQALAQAAARFGTIHVLVNCAGIGRAARTVTKDGPHPFDLFNKVIAVNLSGTFNAIRLAAARMVNNQPNSEGERGVIVNTASVAAFEGQIGQAAYSASKGGVVAMTLPIARDLASRGIRVCTIAPGTFETPMLAGLREENRRVLEAQIRFRRGLGGRRNTRRLRAISSRIRCLTGKRSGSTARSECRRSRARGTSNESNGPIRAGARRPRWLAETVRVLAASVGNPKCVHKNGCPSLSWRKDFARSSVRP